MTRDKPTPDTPASKRLRFLADTLVEPGPMPTRGALSLIARDIHEIARALVVAAQGREKAEHERELEEARTAGDLVGRLQALACDVHDRLAELEEETRTYDA